MKFWFVSQGSTYKEEISDGFIYAPRNNDNGETRQYWSNIKNVKKGDIIFSNKNANIVSVGVALTDGMESSIPDSIKGKWNSDGFKVNIKYHELPKNKCLRFSEFKEVYMKDIDLKNNPFTCKGSAKQGYLFPLDQSIAEFFIKKINDKSITKLISDIDSKYMQELEQLEETRQLEEIVKGRINRYSDAEIEKMETKKYTYVAKKLNDKDKVSRENTDPRLKVTRMEKANYNCEINHDHKTFFCVSGRHQYLECHHIIPLSAQCDFSEIKLDSMFNIISVCPTCHAKVHYALLEEKEKIFINMYKLREKEMLEHGFDLIKIKEVFNKYYK